MRYLLVAAASLAMAACGPQLNITHAPTPLTPKEVDIAEHVHIAVNNYRKEHGKPPLEFQPRLNRYATLHSQYLRDNPGQFKLYGPDIGHDGFEQRSFVLRQTNVVNTLGENVAMPYLAPPAAVAASAVYQWDKSPSHKNNMLLEWDLDGIGVAITPTQRVIVTQLFGTNPTRSIVRPMGAADSRGK